MRNIILTLVLLLTCNYYSQEFVVLDAETMEYIENVDYKLFFKNKKVFEDKCKSESNITLPTNINFDAIELSHTNYNSLLIDKSKLKNRIFMEKKSIELDEVVVVNNKVILGEQTELSKKGNIFEKELLRGLRFENKTKKKLLLEKITFYVDRVDYATKYKIKIFNFKETPINDFGRQQLCIEKLLIETEILALNPKQKGEISVNIEERGFEIGKNSIFVTFELIDYLDKNQNVIEPEKDKLTTLKYRYSNEVDYFTTYYDNITKKNLDCLQNVNAWLNYDYANVFKTKSPKKAILTPSILLHTRIVN